jgi:hypothetical protein
MKKLALFLSSLLIGAAAFAGPFAIVGGGSTDLASPGPIGGTTPAAATFTTVVSTGGITIPQASSATSIITSTGYSLTGSNATPMIDLAGTWNTTGVVPAIKLNITNTASGTASSFMDFLLGGVTQYTFQKNGYLTATGAFQINSSLAADDTGLTTKAAGKIRWSSTASYAGTADTFIVRSAAATIQQGDANAASPVAQTLQAQGSRSGTDSNVGGANYTIQSGTGTGTGAVSTLIFRSPTVVASGTGAQTQITGLTIKNGVAITPSYAAASLPTCDAGLAGGRALVTDANSTTFLAAVAGGGANIVPAVCNGTGWVIGEAANDDTFARYG